ncbi:hypothetical protein HII31_11160 [Pseudocercospora fuligena]|uniref:Swt1-like HEPN domain-containing protein n=1 Tax=Pseudocercospora fuligena TaxID=685502 RepID=A0A8H6RCK0_9PEZI|nr:hypothetical protein HII31_11160 [Pseudocercospora fuligena]
MKIGPYPLSVVERELQEENDDLRKQVEQLTAERDKYQELYYDRLQCPTTNTFPAEAPCLTEPKGYLKSTKSSERRRVDTQLAPSSATRKSLARRAENQPNTWGTKADDSQVIDTKYLSDCASGHRETSPEPDTEPSLASDPRCNQFQCVCGGSGDGYGCDYRRPQSCTCILCTHFSMTYAGKESYPSNDLCSRTTLTASEFYDTSRGRAYVRFNKVLKLLHKAHRLARDSTWHAFHNYWPEFQRKNFRYGPWQVRFGWGEMAPLLNGEFGGIVARNRKPNVYNNVCDMPPDVVNRAILNMADLRNLLAHPHEISPKDADSMLQKAQELTCVLRDEHRATQIRSLRNDLQVLVSKALKEIVDYEPLSHLPGARYWALHHQYTFEWVIGYLHRHNQSDEERRRIDTLLNFKDPYGLTPPDKYFHPAVVAAAITWISRFQTSGANLPLFVHMPLSLGLPPEPPLPPDQASEEVINFVQGIDKDKRWKEEMDRRREEAQ